MEYHHITGSGDFILRIVAEDIESYQELMLDKVSEIEVTDSLQSMVILSTFKKITRLYLFKIDEKYCP